LKIKCKKCGKIGIVEIREVKTSQNKIRKYVYIKHYSSEKYKSKKGKGSQVITHYYGTYEELQKQIKNSQNKE